MMSDVSRLEIERLHTQYDQQGTIGPFCLNAMWIAGTHDWRLRENVEELLEGIGSHSNVDASWGYTCNNGPCALRIEGEAHEPDLVKTSGSCWLRAIMEEHIAKAA